jgi:acyl dehydratase
VQPAAGDAVPLWPKGHFYEDFEVGQIFAHHWGRTILESDNAVYSCSTLNYNPLYVNRMFARDAGHPDIVCNPMLAFLVVLGLSVEDLSEKHGGAFLGVDALAYHRPVYAGDTLTATSIVTAKRESRSRPAAGIVSWETRGMNQELAPVLSFHRTNLVARRGGRHAVA